MEIPGFKELNVRKHLSMFRRTADPWRSVSKNSRTFQQKRHSSRNWVDVRYLRCYASSCDFKTASVYALLLRVSFNAVRSTAAVAGCTGRCWISVSFSLRDRWDDKRKTLYICMQKNKTLHWTQPTGTFDKLNSATPRQLCPFSCTTGRQTGTPTKPTFPFPSLGTQ